MVGGLAALIASAASAALQNSQSDTQHQTLLVVQLAAWCAFLVSRPCMSGAEDGQWGGKGTQSITISQLARGPELCLPGPLCYTSS